jgi:signal transduction histidine kinase/CheY-like chemotaxis protein
MIEFYKEISAIGSSTSSSQYLTDVLKIACEKLDFLTGVVIINQKKWKVVASHNLPNDAQKLLENIEQKNNENQFYDLADNPIPKSFDKLARLYGVKSSVILPLVVQNNIYGQMILFDIKRHTPSKDDRVILEHIRTLLSISISKQELFIADNIDTQKFEKKLISHSFFSYLSKCGLEEDSINKFIGNLGLSLGCDSVTILETRQDKLDIVNHWNNGASSEINKDKILEYISKNITSINENSHLYFDEVKFNKNYPAKEVLIVKSQLDLFDKHFLVFENYSKKNNLDVLDIQQLELVSNYVSLLINFNSFKNHNFNYDVLNYLPDRIFIVNNNGDVKNLNSRKDKINHNSKLNDLLPQDIASLIKINLNKESNLKDAYEFRYMLNLPIGIGFRECRLIRISQDEHLLLIRDITEKSNHEKSIKQNALLQKAQLDNMPFGIFIIDENMNVIDFNNTLQKKYFKGNPEITSSKVLDLFGDSQMDILNRVKGLFNLDFISTQTFDIVHNENSFGLRLYLIPILDDYGKPKNIQGLIEEITENSYNQKILKEAKELAELANNAKTEFLANISHEIRTPLNSLLGFVELSLKENNIEKIRRYLNVISDSANALNSLTSDLLDISKIESKVIQINNSVFDLPTVINEVKTILESKLASTENDLVTKIFDTIQPFYYSDRTRLRQILINLLDNAIKFTSCGTITLEVYASKINEENDNVKFVISDNGIGVPDSMRETIFEPFFQVDSSASKRHGGSGLGLAITKGIITQMGGTIYLKDSCNPKGATFVVELPLKIPPKTIFEINLPDSFMFLNCDDELIINQITEIIEKLDVKIYRKEDLSSIKNKSNIILISDKPEMILDSFDKKILIGNCNKQISNVLTIDNENLCDNLLASLVTCLPNNQKICKEFLVNKKILVVEDNKSNLLFMDEIMIELKTEVVNISTGKGAFDTIANTKFDACLMDLQMPDLSGFDVTVSVRNLEEKNKLKRLPIIALTAFATNEDKKKSLDIGMDFYLSKPVKVKDLVSTLSLAIAHSYFEQKRTLLDELSENLLIEKTKLREMLLDYVKMSYERLDLVEKLLRKSMYHEALKEIHDVKGMAYVDTLFKTVVSIETSIRSNNLEESCQLISKLRIDLDSFSKCLD